MKHKGLEILTIIIVCILLVSGCLGLEWLIKDKEKQILSEKTHTKPTAQESYNGYGLPVGTELSQVKLLENDEVVCYEDRAFFRFQYEEDNADNAKAIVRGILERCPMLEQVYVMPVPPRILIEDGYPEDCKNYDSYIKQLNEGKPDKCKVLDVSSNVVAHKDEYVFYRSENAWTARGAYYGAQVFLESTEREIVPLDEYEEYVGRNFVGNMSFQTGIPKFNIGESTPFLNPLYYYQLKDSLQRVEIILNEGDVLKSYKKPLFTPSTVNLSAVIDSSFVRAIVAGKSMDGNKTEQYLMVICDYSGKWIVPYLKDYYAGIYVINVYKDNYLYQDICDLLVENNITEVMWVQDGQELGKKGYSKALTDFVEEE